MTDDAAPRVKCIGPRTRFWGGAQRPAIWLAIHCHLTLLPLLAGIYFFDSFWLGALYFIWPFPLMLLGIAFAGLHSVLKLTVLLCKAARITGAE